jgi:hypothetical protein
MPVAMLFVEGELDAQVLQPILKGRPVVDPGGSKYGLRPKVREKRKKGVLAAYLRDRDFDYDPPKELGHPEVDAQDSSGILGWRWSRHAIENYLLEPSVVASATGCGQADYEAELVACAQRLRFYQAARWVVGKARRGLPPNWRLNTRPDQLAGRELAVPEDLSERSMRHWASTSIARFREHVLASLDENVVQASIDERCSELSEQFLGSTTNVLLWCAGKDLLAGMREWLSGHGFESGAMLMNRVRDWIRGHPDDALKLLPEWQALMNVLSE